MKRIDKIKHQLGLSLGTATHRLRKSIMFELVKQTGLDMCYRCSNKIENIDEFSIEHKTSWFNSNNPIELFYSLDNIAFSHLKCNCDFAEQNQRNKRNKFGYKGVIFDKRRPMKPYRANNWDGKKYIKSKNFNTIHEAAKEYDRIAIKLFGNDVQTNELLGKFINDMPS